MAELLKSWKTLLKPSVNMKAGWHALTGKHRNEVQLTILWFRDGNAAILGFGRHRILKSSRGGQTCSNRDVHIHVMTQVQSEGEGLFVILVKTEIHLFS